jgi:hypothetical protein
MFHNFIMGFIAILFILACSFNKGYQMFTLSCLHLVGKFFVYFFCLILCERNNWNNNVFMGTQGNIASGKRGATKVWK